MVMVGIQHWHCWEEGKTDSWEERWTCCQGQEGSQRAVDDADCQDNCCNWMAMKVVDIHSKHAEEDSWEAIEELVGSWRETEGLVDSLKPVDILRQQQC